MTIRTLKGGNFSVRIAPGEKAPFKSTIEILKKDGIIDTSFLRVVTNKNNAYQVAPSSSYEPSYVKRCIRLITAL